MGSSRFERFGGSIVCLKQFQWAMRNTDLQKDREVLWWRPSHCSLYVVKYGERIQDAVSDGIVTAKGGLFCLPFSSKISTPRLSSLMHCSPPLVSHYLSPTWNYVVSLFLQMSVNQGSSYKISRSIWFTMANWLWIGWRYVLWHSESWSSNNCYF